MEPFSPRAGRSSPVAFQLSPFPGEPSPPGLSIGGGAERQDGRLRIHYQLSGPLEQLRIPEPTDAPQRRDELWQSTCLEGFLARPGEDRYWELNLSPAGHWNVYRLEGYRRGLTAEPAVTQAPGRDRRQGPGRLALTLELQLPPPLAQAEALELAITAVIEARDGALSYWALHHPGPQADFHHRGGFALLL